MKQLTSIRLEKKETKKANQLARLLQFDQSIVMRQAFETGMKNLSQETAIKLYSEEKLSLSEAAELAEVSVGEFMEVLAKRGVRQEISSEFLEEALENARKLINEEH